MNSAKKGDCGSHAYIEPQPRSGPQIDLVSGDQLEWAGCLPCRPRVGPHMAACRVGPELNSIQLFTLQARNWMSLWLDWQPWQVKLRQQSSHREGLQDVGRYTISADRL